MSDGKLQIQAELVTDVSQSDVMQRKLAELTASAANASKEINRVSVQQDKTFRARSAMRAARQFASGDAEGGLYTLSQMGTRLDGLLLKASLFSAVFIGAFKVGANYVEKAIEKIDALAKHYQNLADQINSSTRAKVKSDATFAAQRIDKAKDKARTQTETRLGDIERREREAAAQRELSKATKEQILPRLPKPENGAAEHPLPATPPAPSQSEESNGAPSEPARPSIPLAPPPSQASFDVEKATARADIQRDLLAAYETELAASKKRAADMERGAARAQALNDGTGADLQLNAALQQKQVRELAETVEQERVKLAELNAELETARRVASIEDQAAAARQMADDNKAASLASEAKRSYARAQMKPSEMLQDMIREAEELRQTMDAMPAGSKRSETETDYYQMMERILDVQASEKDKHRQMGVTPASDAYARIGGLIGGGGASGLDFNRRTATATERAVNLLQTISGKLEPEPKHPAIWG